MLSKYIVFPIVFSLLVLGLLGGDPPDSVNTSEYQLGPGDLLAVSLHGMDELDSQVRVSNSGKIHLPFLGVMSVFGKSPTDLELDIAKELAERDLVKEPWVRVEVLQYRSRPVYCLGEVMQPGQFIIPYNFTLLDLITMAGGVNQDVKNGGYGYLYRRRVGSKASADSPPEIPDESEVSYDVTRIDLGPLVRGEDPNLNIRLQGGEVFHVVLFPDDIYYVVGDIAQPGDYDLPRGEPILATQAILAAGGPTRTAKAGESILIRTSESGERQELAVNFEAILMGKAPDFSLQAGDIIFVPGSGVKSFAYGLMGVIPSVTARAVQRAGVRTY